MSNSAFPAASPVPAASTDPAAASTNPAAPTNPAASLTTTTPTPPRPPPYYVPQGSHATRAFGVILEKEQLDYWCTRQYNKLYGAGAMEKVPRKKYSTVMGALWYHLLRALQVYVYEAFPNLPRLRRNLIVLCASPEMYLFVFKDNSSHAALHLTLKAVDVNGVQELLGVEGRAEWYRVRIQ